jgi:hypothetical protein
MHFGPHEKRNLTVLMVREESPVAVRESSECEAWKESGVSARSDYRLHSNLGLSDSINDERRPMSLIKPLLGSVSMSFKAHSLSRLAIWPLAQIQQGIVMGNGSGAGSPL